jgi:hypothetical protein
MSGERDEYPEAPRNYFDDGTAATLAGTRQRALQGQCGPAQLEEMLSLVSGSVFSSSWKPPAVRLYENWLAHVVRDGLRPCPVGAMTLARSGEGRGELVQ